jgi:hypothetical protein
MLKTIIGAAILLSFFGCGNAPPPTAVSPAPYTVISEQPTASGADAVSIRMTGPPSQAAVKSIAETIINERKARFTSVTVTTYVPDTGSSGLVYATSTFDGHSVSHNFNDRVQDQRIATH